MIGHAHEGPPVRHQPSAVTVCESSTLGYIEWVELVAIVCATLWFIRVAPIAAMDQRSGMHAHGLGGSGVSPII